MPSSVVLPLYLKFYADMKWTKGSSPCHSHFFFLLLFQDHHKSNLKSTIFSPWKIKLLNIRVLKNKEFSTPRETRTKAEFLKRQYLNICLAKKPKVKMKIRNSLLGKKSICREHDHRERYNQLLHRKCSYHHFEIDCFNFIRKPCLPLFLDVVLLLRHSSPSRGP